MKSLILRISSVLLILLMATSNAGASKATLKDTVDDWLDASLARKKEMVVQAITTMNDEFGERNRISTDVGEGKSWGYAHKPGTSLDYSILHLIKDLSKHKGRRLSVADLGCGLGHLAAFAVLAGARVDAVEKPERAKLVHETMHKILKPVFFYRDDYPGAYYKVYASSILSKEDPSWMKTPHDLICAVNVIHYFSDTQIKFFAKRVFEHLSVGGVLVVNTDTPFWCQEMLDYYNARRETSDCPGMGIHSIKKEGRNQFKGYIIPYDPQKYKIRPGDIGEGIFHADGHIEEKEGWRHYYYSSYLLKELAAIFEGVGFKVARQYYLLDNGVRCNDESQLSPGKLAKACLFLEK